MKLIAFLLSTLSLLTAAQGAEDPLPHWIWSDSDRSGGSSATFYRNFTIESPIAEATMKVTADFAAATISVNETAVATLEPYDPPIDLDLRSLISQGENRVEISATGVPGPSAIAAKIEILLENGSRLVFPTGNDWSDQKAVAICPVHPQRWASNELPAISPFAEYNQWKEALDSTEEALSPLPPGFEIERLHTARENEGSWVSLAIDPQGRLIIAREQEGLLRMTLPGDNSSAGVEVEVIDETLKECRGLAWKGDSLFANANRSLALYRLRDTTGDDQFDEVTLIKETEGKTGHGRNDLAIGPDGRVHAIHGDVVLVPEDAEKRTVPEQSAPEELGHWVSTTTDSEGWRVHCRGLRNPYGIDFNNDGEPFTYDADNEGDVGLPFYRPTRINHLVSGANYGWHQDRENSRNLTVWAPDSVPTTFDVGRGSPTAVKFAYQSNFPEKYRNALFALDWAYGRIIAVHLTPRGASYYGSGEVFLEGRPLNVTDLDFAADGSMLFVTGGRKTQSALYRVRYTGNPEPSPAPNSQATARAEFSAGARERRRSLERYHGNPDPPDFEDAWEALGDPDPWIRNAARVAVETQDPERWKQRALSAGNELHGLMALLALARTNDSETDSVGIVNRLTNLETSEQWDRNEQLTYLRILEICHSQQPIELSDSTITHIETWLDSLSDPVRREAVRILVAAKSPSAVAAGLRLAADASDQLERLHYLEMLADASAGWTPEQRESYFQAIIHAKRLSYGDRFMAAFFQAVEGNALTHIPDPEARQSFAARLIEEPAPLPEIKPRKMVKHWTLADFSDSELSGNLAKRDLDQGRKMFDAALCSRCHVAGSHGRPVGPDLTTVASRFSRRDLLESIIDPSKVVAEVHRNIIIQKKDGSVVQGRIMQNDFRQSLLYVAADPFQPAKLTEVPKAEIESSEESPVSPMPPSLLDTLEKDEILDLIAWLESVR